MTEKVKAVEEVFLKLDQEIASFQSWSTLRCKFGCGKCCFKPDIEATILEFLPFAYHLHQEGAAYDWLQKLTDSKDSICLILNPTQPGSGLCSEYPYRGLICRLFGYSARTTKYALHELVTCQVIKAEQPEAYEAAAKQVGGNAQIPIMSTYYMLLHGIDADLTRDFYPINTAMRKAIETILHYYAYREASEA